MLTRHAHNRRSRNRLLRGRGPRRGGGALTLRQQIGQVLGVEPQVFADARDLDVGDGNAVATWGDWSGVVGGATLDADGWGGSLPGVTLGTGDALVTATDAANYGADTHRVWALSAIVQTSGTNCVLLGANESRDNADASLMMSRLGSNGAVLIRTREDSSNEELELGTAVPTGVRVHIGMVYDGASVSVRALTSGGLSSLLSNAPHSLTASLTLTEMMLGSALGGWATLPGVYCVSSLTRVASPTVQQLDDVLNLHNQAYPVA